MLRLYDTQTREVRDFVPLEEGKAGLYVCGLTVQSEPHVGHVRSAVNFDVLQRWLRHVGYEVTFIRNTTDIDDKILIKAAEQGRPWYNLAYAMKRELDKAYAALNVAPPTYEPAATGHIPEMLELIGQLIEKGHAYPAEDGSGDVYFDVRSWPAYGELTHQKIDDMEAAEDADPRGKRDPRDFALWKGWKKESEPETAAWPSPWGRGRPGWHIECSAMAGKYLGTAFDIHGGGVDLRFPHHENEQAQSRAAGPPVRVVLDAQRLDHHRRREDEQVARQQPADPRGARAATAASSCATTSSPRTTAATSSSASRRSTRRRPASAGSRTSSTGRAASGPRRRSRRRSRPRWTTTSARRPRWPSSTTRCARATASSPRARTRRRPPRRCAAMLDVLGLDPADPAWPSSGGADDQS